MDTLAWIATLVIILGGLVILWIAWSGVAGAPWLPTARHRVHRMLNLADVQPDETLYDLGAGDGRVLVTAARDFGARAVGIEIDPLRCLWIRLRLARRGLTEQTAIVCGNLFHEDLGAADVVVVYLRQDTNNRLMQKLWRELRPGARVVSNTFVFPGWEVASIDREEHLYLYRMPDRELRPDGTRRVRTKTDGAA